MDIINENSNYHFINDEVSLCDKCFELFSEKYDQLEKEFYGE